MDVLMKTLFSCFYFFLFSYHFDHLCCEALAYHVCIHLWINMDDDVQRSDQVCKHSKVLTYSVPGHGNAWHHI
jgi:hypothetical protein